MAADVDSSSSRRLNLDIDANILNSVEFIKGRFSFISYYQPQDVPKSSKYIHCFEVDRRLRHKTISREFGPLNISRISKYCAIVKEKLESERLKNKHIVHYTSDGPEKRANAALLVGAYAVLCLDYTPAAAMNKLNYKNGEIYLEYYDSYGATERVSILDCLHGLKRASDWGFFDPHDFDCAKYDYFRIRPRKGDFTWIVPERLLAFRSPSKRFGRIENFWQKEPEGYLPYFLRHSVTTIVRVNTAMYNSEDFTVRGLNHVDLYFTDGSPPSLGIVRDFMKSTSKSLGAVAVHCLAGLGRTGTLIACYLIGRYGFTAMEAITWIRMCRPASINGHQQIWLIRHEGTIRIMGAVYCPVQPGDPLRPQHGIYSKRARHDHRTFRTYFK